MITDSDYTGRLDDYDPTVGDGPWWYDSSSDVHYWNGNHCLEVMAERNLSIAEVTGINFVDHRQKRCCIDPVSCPDLGISGEQIGARLIAAGLLKSPEIDPYALTKSDGTDLPDSSVERATHRLHSDIMKWDFGVSGVVKQGTPSGDALLRAILRAYAHDNLGEAQELSRLFALQSDLLDSLEALHRAELGGWI